MLILAAVALLRYRRRDPQVRFWGWAGLLASSSCWAAITPSTLTWYIPVYNLFRIPSRHLLELDLALAVLGALGWTTCCGRRKRTGAGCWRERGRCWPWGCSWPCWPGPSTGFWYRPWQRFPAGAGERPALGQPGYPGPPGLRGGVPAGVVPVVPGAAPLPLGRGGAGGGGGPGALQLLGLHRPRELFHRGAAGGGVFILARRPGGTAPETRVLYTGTYPYNMDPVNQEIAMLNGYESLIIDDFVLPHRPVAFPERSELAQPGHRQRHSFGRQLRVRGGGERSEPLGLETLLATAGAVSGQMQFWSSLDSDWKGDELHLQDGELRLSAPAGGPPGPDIHAGISLNDGGRYLVTFTARADQASPAASGYSMEVEKMEGYRLPGESRSGGLLPESGIPGGHRYQELPPDLLSSRLPVLHDQLHCPGIIYRM